VRAHTASHSDTTHCSTLQHAASHCYTLRHRNTRTTYMCDDRPGGSICAGKATHVQGNSIAAKRPTVATWAWETLQHTATQHTATRCNILQHTKIQGGLYVCGDTLRGLYMCGATLQHTAAQRTATHCITL